MDLELTEANAPPAILRGVSRASAWSTAASRPIAPISSRKEAIKELSELGIMGIFVPETYGGAGMDHVSYALAIEELSVQCAATGVIVSAHSSLGVWPILGLGHRAIKSNISCPTMATGKAYRMLRPDRAAGRFRRRRTEDPRSARRRFLRD